MHRGELTGKADAKFFSPLVRQKLHSLDHSPFVVKSLGSLLSGIRYGTGTPPPLVEPGPNARPFVRATDIKEGEIHQAEMLFIASEQPKLMDKCRLAAGEIILVRSGVNTGDCAVVPENLAGAFAAYDLILTPGDSVLPDFLNLYLATGVGRLQLDLVRGRAAQPHVNAEEVSALRVPVPPLKGQRQLIGLMEEARLERRAKLMEADTLLVSFDRYLMEALGLRAPVRIPRQIYGVRSYQIAGVRFDAQYHQPHYAKVTAALAAGRYDCVSLETLSPEIVGGATPTRGDQDLYTDSGIRFLRILNVKPNEIAEDDMNFIREHVHQTDLRRSQLEMNDILMTITGRVGTAAVVPAEVLPANINQHIVRLRLASNDCLPAYLAAYLNSSFGLILSNRGVTGGTRIALDYGTIRAIQIPLPPLEMQDQIVGELQRQRNDARRLRSEAERDWNSAKRRFEGRLLEPTESSAISP